MDEQRVVSDVRAAASPEDLSAFYDRYLSEVYAFVYRRCAGDVALAEDITQETFVHVARNFASTSEPPTLGWLYRVARNRLIDHWRAQSRKERKLRLVGNSSQDAAAGDPVDVVVSGHLVLEALAVLPASQRAALVLRYLDGYTTKEVAVALDRSAKATESLLARARRGLELTLGERIRD